MNEISFFRGPMNYQEGDWENIFKKKTAEKPLIGLSNNDDKTA